MKASCGMWASRMRASANRNRPQEGESQADPVGFAAVGIHARKDGDGSAQGGDLRQRQVHEDHAALHHVHAQVGVNAGQDQAGQKRQREELKDFHSFIVSRLLRCLEGFASAD